MSMKYYRFLFQGMNGCFANYGELTDAETGEQMTFLYLNRTEKAAIQADENIEFVCPGYIDLVVLGCSDPVVWEVWKRLGERTKAGALVYAGNDSGAGLHAAQVLQLSKQRSDWCCQKIGWKIFLKTYDAESVVMMYGLDTDGARIEDCVMNVKALKQHRRCHAQQKPDGYGCALGCVLHQDYDVCKYQEEGQMPGQLTGTVLLAGSMQHEVMEQLWNDLEKQPWKLRFLALPKYTQKQVLSAAKLQNTLADRDYKTYYISMDADTDAAFAEKISERGFNHSLIAVRKEQGLCCSGLVKYNGKVR